MVWVLLISANIPASVVPNAPVIVVVIIIIIIVAFMVGIRRG